MIFNVPCEKLDALHGLSTAVDAASYIAFQRRVPGNRNK